MHRQKIIIGCILSVLCVSCDAIDKENLSKKGCRGYLYNCPQEILSIEKEYRKIPGLGIPQDIAQECLKIFTFGGEGYLTFSVKGDKDYYWTEDPRGYDSARVLVFCPGYQIVKKKIQFKKFKVFKENLKKIRLEKIPSSLVEINGRLMDSWGNPVEERKLGLSYYLEAMLQDYCIDCLGSYSTVGIATTDQVGNFKFRIHPFMNDKLFSKQLSNTQSFDLFLEVEGRNDTPTWVLEPATIPIRQKYDEVISLTMKTARLEGTIPEKTWHESGLSGEIAPSGWDPRLSENWGDPQPKIILQARSGPYEREEWKYNSKTKREELGSTGEIAYHKYLNCQLKDDRSFSVILPPETYDIYLTGYKNGAVYENILIKKDVVLKEGESKSLIFE